MNDRRQLPDRRHTSTKSLSIYTLRGRRKKARRIEEAENYYVDRYEFRYLFLIISILVLCFLDAFLTVILLQLGAKELNPFMLILIEKDVVLSMIIKYVITAFSLIFILVHKNFRIFKNLRVHALIYFVLTLYVALVLFEFISYVKIVGYELEIFSFVAG
ncbi:MAG: DUF5658 family protein [Candidatus Aminicenantes bacterium]